MLGALKNKYSILYLVSIPVLLLILAVAYNNGNELTFVKEVNPYLNTMPSAYATFFETNRANDSTFFSAVIDHKYSRELVIGRAFPNKNIMKTDFLVDVFPADKKLIKSEKDFLSLNLVNDAAVFNHNGKTFGLYKQSLPFIDIDKISIKQKALYKQQKVWSGSLVPDFAPVSGTKPNAIEGMEEKRKPSAYSDVYNAILKEFDISYLPYELFRINDELFHVNEGMDDLIDENQLTIGVFENENQLWKSVNTRDKKLLQSFNVKGKFAEDAKDLIDQYVNNDLALEALFDIQKLARFLAVKQLFSKGCNEAFSVLYNPDNRLLEPFSMGSGCLGQMLNYIPKPGIENINFIETYVLSMNEVTEIDISEILENVTAVLIPHLETINQYDPLNIFSPDIIRINQRVIRKSLNASSLIKAEILDVDPSKMTVSVLNMSNYPVEIRELNHKTKKIISGLNPRQKILNGTKDTIVIDLPRSFENLFVSKKKKLTGFNLFKHFPEIYIGYSVAGLEGIHYASVIPYQTKEVVEEDLFRSPTSIETREDISIDNKAKTISFSKKKVIISEPLIIPKGYTFVVKAGTQIDIVDGGKIISYAPLKFEGTQQEKIQFMSSDNKGQGMLVLADGKESLLKFVKFDNLSNPKHGSWSVTGALSFYESPAKFNNVVIENNRCEDALNMIRTTFHMRFCRISNTQSDAFDGDFVKGNIIDCKFNDLGNDAIDISGSELIIKRVEVRNAGDKGLSAGEDSKMDVANVKIFDSEIGLAGKDLSIVEVKDLEISNTKLAFTAFQKKPEFGPSHIKVNGVTMTNIETKYLIESTSSLIVDGEKIETSQNVKDRMYGVEFGRSSAETNQ